MNKKIICSDGSLVVLTDDPSFLRECSANGVPAAGWIRDDVAGAATSVEFAGAEHLVQTLFYDENDRVCSPEVLPEEITPERTDMPEHFWTRIAARDTGRPWVLLRGRTKVRELTMTDAPALLWLAGEFPGESSGEENEIRNGKACDESGIRLQLKEYESFYRLFGLGKWGIEQDGELIGIVGVTLRDEEGVWEFGYQIRKDHQRQGIAGDICRKILPIIKEELAGEKVEIRVREDNEASLRLAKKLCREFEFLKLVILTEKNKGV